MDSGAFVTFREPTPSAWNFLRATSEERQAQAQYALAASAAYTFAWPAQVRNRLYSQMPFGAPQNMKRPKVITAKTKDVIATYFQSLSTP